MPPILNWLASAVPGSSIPTSPLAAQLRDIHPGPPLQLASDPRLLGWWWLLIALLVGAMIILGVQSLLRYHRWRRQLDWQAPDLVPQLQAVLREAVLPRWPEAASLQGAPWLAFLDSLGGSRFRELAPHWSAWLYGGQIPDAQQRQALRRAYLALGRHCICPPSWLLDLRTRWRRGRTRTSDAHAGSQP
ncbi:DUF4381 domain-containing protein [Aeromonas hydrophila]|uniref:DUF4381 domain-containing protein n=1 Tax=Aeromonas hydrophila TaxID=644 RepID=UPI0004DA62EA|nr:DUF4381 domain-containing protein [Aeromonas hydrophila]EJN6956575.1 DUF4381 domain-containing protein [Aeromonas hydrophila]KER63018.1 hypothetical protein HR52_08455 [Aeromonas hydrophila]MCX4041294.1 DUF4381 domain-containing protein [Aeromonas hydrophila]OCA65026.1 hypothetical protein A9R12_14530 [Aeromonas hydrophila]OCY06456.1 hypothetical protein A9X69_12880 [Aeromonas hydrophila]